MTYAHKPVKSEKSCITDAYIYESTRFLPSAFQECIFLLTTDEALDAEEEYK